MFKMRQHTLHKYKQKLAVRLLALIALISLTLLPLAVSAQAVTNAYNSDTSLQRGMIVGITPSDKTKVEAVSEKSSTKIEGVIVAANDSPVTLSNSDTSKQQVFVATTGHYNVLVSNQNGVIKANDYIAMSSLNGVGAKAGNQQSVIVGKALDGFDGKTHVSGTISLKNSSGTTSTVAIGLISVDISISHNPLEKATESKIPGIGVLQSGAKAIVNKTVDPARLYLSVLILVIVTAIAGSMLYGGVRTSLVSIGRNPLAKASIMRGMFQVLLTSIIIFIIGIVGVYLLLKL